MVHFHDLLSVLNLRDIRRVIEIKMSCDSHVSCVSSNCLRFNLFPSSFLSVSGLLDEALLCMR